MDEIEIASVVGTQWMFWAKRFMRVLKGYVRQKARPEGSMPEGWILLALRKNTQSGYLLLMYALSQRTLARGEWGHHLVLRVTRNR